MTPNGRLRVGVVGAGWWSTQCHLPALIDHPRADVAAIVEPDRGRLSAAADHYAVGPRFAGIGDLVASELADAVIVATPHAYHYAVALEALEAGLHVLVEKPMTLEAWQAHHLVHIAERQGLQIMVGFTFHFTPHVRFVREVLRAGRIGDITYISGLYASNVQAFYRGDPDAYRHIWNYPVTGAAPGTYSDPTIAGGGQGQLQVSHAMALVFWLTGARATEVSALMANADLPLDLADAIVYRLDSGTIGTMGSTGSLQPDQPQQQEFRFYGTRGFVLLDLIRGTAEVHLNDGTTVRETAAADEIYPGRAPARAFVDLVLGGGENPAPGEIGVATVEFLECAYRSAASGAMVRPDSLAASTSAVTS